MRNRLLSDPILTHTHTRETCASVCAVDSHSHQNDGTHGDNAVRLDLVDPEALLHHGAGSVEQLFQLAQSEWANLWETPERSDHTESSGEEQPRPLHAGGRHRGKRTAKMWTLETHQVGHVDDIGGFATRRRRLPGGADGVVDGDRHARLLLTNGATHHAVARGNWRGDWRGQMNVTDETRQRRRGSSISLRSCTFRRLPFVLDGRLRFWCFLTNTVLGLVSGRAVLVIFLSRLHLLLFLRLSIFVALAGDNLIKTIETRGGLSHDRRNFLISPASIRSSEFVRTCVTVRRILRPLSWSSRPASWLSSSPDSCSSSGCSSTTASWFNLMSGIRDCRATATTGGKIKPISADFFGGL